MLLYNIVFRFIVKKQCLTCSVMRYVLQVQFYKSLVKIKQFVVFFVYNNKYMNEKQNIKYYNPTKTTQKPFLSKWCPYWGTWGSRGFDLSLPTILSCWRKYRGRDSKKKVIFAIHDVTTNKNVFVYFNDSPK